jgi:hypothetical protein
MGIRIREGRRLWSAPLLHQPAEAGCEDVPLEGDPNAATPAVTLVIANHGGRRACRQSKGAEEADNSASKLLHGRYS